MNEVVRKDVMDCGETGKMALYMIQERNRTPKASPKQMGYDFVDDK